MLIQKRAIDRILTKRLGGKRESIDEATRTATFVFSTSTTDRAGDIIDQASWDLKRYKTNPQFLWAHRSRELPIGKTIDLQVRGNSLIGTVQFATEDEYEFADTCWKLVKGGYLSAVSVGFIPHRWESYDNGDGDSGYKLFDCELLECSLVPIPCNHECLEGDKDIGDLGKLKAHFDGTLAAYDDSLAGVFAKADLESAIGKLFGPADTVSGTKQVPSADPISTLENEAVYDSSGELIGLMVNGAIKVARTYQDSLREKNLAAISQQASAPKAPATTEKEQGAVARNFFLRRSAASARRRRVLIGA